MGPQHRPGCGRSRRGTELLHRGRVPPARRADRADHSDRRAFAGRAGGRGRRHHRSQAGRVRPRDTRAQGVARVLEGGARRHRRAFRGDERGRPPGRPRGEAHRGPGAARAEGEGGADARPRSSSSSSRAGRRAGTTPRRSASIRRWSTRATCCRTTTRGSTRDRSEPWLALADAVVLAGASSRASARSGPWPRPRGPTRRSSRPVLIPRSSTPGRPCISTDQNVRQLTIGVVADEELGPCRLRPHDGEPGGLARPEQSVLERCSHEQEGMGTHHVVAEPGVEPARRPGARGSDGSPRHLGLDHEEAHTPSSRVPPSMATPDGSRVSCITLREAFAVRPGALLARRAAPSARSGGNGSRRRSSSRPRNRRLATTPRAASAGARPAVASSRRGIA